MTTVIGLTTSHANDFSKAMSGLETDRWGVFESARKWISAVKNKEEVPNLIVTDEDQLEGLSGVLTKQFGTEAANNIPVLVTATKDHETVQKVGGDLNVLGSFPSNLVYAHSFSTLIGQFTICTDMDEDLRHLLIEGAISDEEEGFVNPDYDLRRVPQRAGAGLELAK